MIKRNYKPKAKNEVALKTYIKNAIKKGDNRHSGNRGCKSVGVRNNNIC